MPTEILDIGLLPALWSGFQGVLSGQEVPAAELDDGEVFRHGGRGDGGGEDQGGQDRGGHLDGLRSRGARYKVRGVVSITYGLGYPICPFAHLSLHRHKGRGATNGTLNRA